VLFFLVQSYQLICSVCNCCLANLWFRINLIIINALIIVIIIIIKIISRNVDIHCDMGHVVLSSIMWYWYSLWYEACSIVINNVILIFIVIWGMYYSHQSSRNCSPESSVAYKILLDTMFLQTFQWSNFLAAYLRKLPNLKLLILFLMNVTITWKTLLYFRLVEKSCRKGNHISP